MKLTQWTYVASDLVGKSYDVVVTYLLLEQNERLTLLFVGIQFVAAREGCQTAFAP